MFDDGYDYFCLSLVSRVKSDPKGVKHDKASYCGCVAHLEQKTATQSTDVTDDALAEPA